MDRLRLTGVGLRVHRLQGAVHGSTDDQAGLHRKDKAEKGRQEIKGDDSWFVYVDSMLGYHRL